MERLPPDGQESSLPSEMVLTSIQCFQNRWKSIEVVADPEMVRPRDEMPPRNDFLKLKRIKLAAVSRKHLLNLLRILSDTNEEGDQVRQPRTLWELDIEHLELPEGTLELSFEYSKLQLLSISSIILVDENDKKIVDRRPTYAVIKFKAPNLRKVDLGKLMDRLLVITFDCHLDLSCPTPNQLPLSFPPTTGNSSIIHICLSHPGSIHELSIDQDPGDSLTEFTNLMILECNRIDRFDQEKLGKFIAGKLANLFRLNCNTERFDYTEDKPTPEQLEYFEHFHKFVQRKLMLGLVRHGLAIYLNGVQVDSKRPFSDYQFHKPLIQMHQHNELINRLTLWPLLPLVEANYASLSLFYGPNEGFDRKGNYSRFAELYPCVHRVLISKTNRSIQIRADDLLAFLRICKGLLLLRFVAADLPNDFYDRLTELSSCKGLRGLVILESTDFNQTFDFSFLTKFRFLNSLETNLAPRPQMLVMIKAMAEGQRVAFNFNHPSLSANYRYLFKKTKQDWLMSAEMMINGHFYSEMKEHTMSVTWEKLINDFIPPGCFSRQTRHWLKFDENQIEQWFPSVMDKFNLSEGQKMDLAEIEAWKKGVREEVQKQQNAVNEAIQRAADRKCTLS